MNLAELNQKLEICSVDADRLATMGFLPVVLSKCELESLDEATRRKWRAAKLYPISKLQDNALRHWIKRKRKKNLAVKAASHYPACKENLGRVWLISTKDPS